MPRPVLHLICQAHIDPVWLWPWRDGAAEALTTLQSAVDRAREFPAFKFTRSSPAIYRWIKEQDPRLFRQIRALVRADRWEPVGAWIEQPDCNLPAAESFVRQSLYGHAWFEHELGRTTDIGYNVDSFGHAGGLPQLLGRAGLKRYVFMRPQRHEAPEVPDLFWWVSSDGSRVLTQRVPGQYSQSPRTTADDLEALLRRRWREHFSPGFFHGIFWLGIGNHGGGPTREHLQRIVQLQADPALPELRFSTVREYFEAIERSSGVRKLPEVHGELQFHARGCYSATSEVKALNVRAENALLGAETITTLLAHRFGSRPEPGQLAEPWWRLLFHQFHDILAGSCVAATWDETRDGFGSVLQAAQEVRVRAIHSLARRVDTSTEPGGVLFAFNPLPTSRTAIVQLDTFSDPHGRGPITHLERQDGTVIPLQWSEAEANYGPHLMPWGKLTAAVKLPAFGYEVFRLASSSVPAGNKASDVAPVTTKLWTRRSDSGSGVLRAPVSLQIIPDDSDTWAHRVRAFKARPRAMRATSTVVVERGPICTVTRQTYSYGASKLHVDVIAHAWASAVQIRVRGLWCERRAILALSIPTSLKRTQFVARTVAGVSCRPTVGDEQPAHRWTAICGQWRGRPHSVGLINRESYSHSCHGDTLRVILARSTPYAEHHPMKVPDMDPKPFTDHGWIERMFWVAQGPGDWRALDLDRLSTELLTPPEAMIDSAHPGSEPYENSFGEIQGEGIALLALKPAENRNGWIVRVQEMHGKRPRGKLVLPSLRVQHAFTLSPWEIRSWRVTPGRVRQVDLREGDPRA